MTYNVLVVEDTAGWRKKLVGYLVEEGEYDVFEAGDYETARDWIENQPFDVVLIDIRLSDWDETNEQGLELLGQLDQVSAVDGTQAIVITGYGTKETMRKAFRNHWVVGFIEKRCFAPTEFRRAVLGAAERAREARREIVDRE